MATLPALVRREPEVRVVWLDAHGDFNTPGTTASGFLGGMCLAAACGRWDGGFGAGVDPARVVLADARDLDAPEREELEAAGIAPIATADVADAVRGERVFLHLDLDVLDPSEMPCTFPAPGGLAMEDLRALLADLAGAADVVGVEVASMAAPARGGGGGLESRRAGATPAGARAGAGCRAGLVGGREGGRARAAAQPPR